MVTINPRKVFGNWFEGYTLDLHTISSIFLGYDEYGDCHESIHRRLKKII